MPRRSQELRIGLRRLLLNHPPIKRMADGEKEQPEKDLRAARRRILGEVAVGVHAEGFGALDDAGTVAPLEEEEHL